MSPDGLTTEAVGVETLGGVFTPLIERGTRTPCSISEGFTTAADGQSELLVTLYRGNDHLAARNHPLGQFKVAFPPAPRGVPRIQITFAIKRGAITLAARDLARGVALEVVKVMPAGG
ncbi:MAG: Hsp70 family protein [Anaeromyxobacter sp.]